MKCYDYAMKYLYNHPKTEQDLRIKLFQKGYSSEEVQHTMEIVKQKKFVDDAMFAQMYINSEVIKKGKPLLLITRKLELKGVPKFIIQKVAAENQEDAAEGIHKRIRKEIETYKRKDITGFDIIQKLLRKWYKLDDIKFVLHNKHD